MGQSSALERAKVREVTGVFHSRDAIDAAASDLLHAGFDRADVDVLATLDEIYDKLGPAYVAPEELADVPKAPRRPFLGPEDVTLAMAIVAGILGFAGAIVAVFSVLARGGTPMFAAIAALVVGVLAGGAGALMVARWFRLEHEKAFEPLMSARGFILWIRTRSPHQEERAQEVLSAYGAKAIRVHEIEIEKRPEDIPLSSLRPDPWLGNEKLGQL